MVLLLIRFSILQTLAIILYPKRYSGAAGYNSGGYEWCVRRWGTKWNACDADITLDTGLRLVDTGLRFGGDQVYQAVVVFRTAWSPPLPVVTKLITMFPKLEFRLEYFECGGGFKGILTGKYGKVTKDYCSSKYIGDRGG